MKKAWIAVVMVCGVSSSVMANEKLTYTCSDLKDGSITLLAWTQDEKGELSRNLVKRFPKQSDEYMSDIETWRACWQLAKFLNDQESKK